MRSGVQLEKAVFGFRLQCGEPSERPSSIRCPGLSWTMGEGLHELAQWPKKEGNWPSAFPPLVLRTSSCGCIPQCSPGPSSVPNPPVTL